MVYDAQFHYIKDLLGGYGLYYSAAISGMGLTLPGRLPPGCCTTPYARRSRRCGRVSGGVADTRYYRDYFDDDHAQVPADVIAEYIRAGCLCQFRTPTAPVRAILQDLFLHWPPGDAEQRRATMRMFLDLAEQTAGHELTEDRFRRLIYFRSAAPGAALDAGPAERTHSTPLAAISNPRVLRLRTKPHVAVPRRVGPGPSADVRRRCPDDDVVGLR